MSAVRRRSRGFGGVAGGGAVGVTGGARGDFTSDGGRRVSSAGDDGAGAVVAIGVLAGMMVAVTGVMSILGVVHAGARAQVLADAAALAGAQVARAAIATGEPPSGASRDSACAVATRVAVRGGGTLISCEVSGGDITVAVSVRAWAGITRAARAGMRGAGGDPG